MSLNLPRLSLHFPSCLESRVTGPPRPLECKEKGEWREWPDFPYPTLSFPMGRPR